ncbi:MAG: tyrosine-type recombinase/integrase [Polyangiales bacterium]
MDEAINRFLENLAGPRSPRTVADYGAVLRAFRSFLGKPTPEATFEEIERFLRRPTVTGTRRAATTWNQERSTLRLFFAFAERRLGFAHLPLEEIRLRREGSRDPAHLTAPEFRSFLYAAAENPDELWRSRDLALLVATLVAGLRVAEIARLDVAQFDREGGILLRVRGKGATEKDMALNDEATALLIDWLEKRASVATADEPALFVSSLGSRISVRTIQRLVTNAARRANLAKRISPHALRHSLASLMAATGADPNVITDRMRHSDPRTTRRYIHLASTREREALVPLSVAIPASLLPRREAPVATEVASALSLITPAEALLFVALTAIAGVSEGAANENDVEGVDVHCPMDARPSDDERGRLAS